MSRAKVVVLETQHCDTRRLPTSSFTYFGDTFPSLHLLRDSFSVAISRRFLAVISNLNISTGKIKEKRREMFVDAVGYKYTYRSIYSNTAIISKLL